MPPGVSADMSLALLVAPSPSVAEGDVPAVGLVKRIRVEEAALRASFGDNSIERCNGRARLTPVACLVADAVAVVLCVPVTGVRRYAGWPASERSARRQASPRYAAFSCGICRIPPAVSGPQALGEVVA